MCFLLGFAYWSKQDYLQFVRLNEQFGRDDVEKISQNFNGKTPEEVVAYYDVFWRHCKDLQDYHRVIAQIERGEAKHTSKRALDAKVKQDIPTYLPIYSFIYLFFTIGCQLQNTVPTASTR